MEEGFNGFVKSISDVFTGGGTDVPSDIPAPAMASAMATAPSGGAAEEGVGKTITDGFASIGDSITEGWTAFTNALTGAEVPAATGVTAAATGVTAATTGVTAATTGVTAAVDTGGGGWDIMGMMGIDTATMDTFGADLWTWTKANKVALILFFILLILVCVAIGMAAAKPASGPAMIAPAPPAPPAALPPMPFQIDKAGNVIFPANVTFAGGLVANGSATFGPATLLNINGPLTVPSLTVNGTMTANSVIATSALTSGVSTSLGGTTSLNGTCTISGGADSYVSVGGHITGGQLNASTDGVFDGANRCVADQDNINLFSNLTTPSGVFFMLGIDATDETGTHVAHYTTDESAYNVSHQITLL